MSLLLYTGQDCSLCVEAEALLHEIDPAQAHSLVKVDVRSTHQLYQAYGARIPVLFRDDNQTELPWPFNHVQLSEFIR